MGADNPGSIFTEAGNVACLFHEAKDQCIFLVVDITAPSRNGSGQTTNL